MPRFLPIKNPDGSWIDRPGLYVLSLMSYEDKLGLEVVEQLFAAMHRPMSESPDLNPLERDIADRHLKRHLRHRLFAGQAVLEMVRIAATTKKSPSQAQAVRLVALNQGEFDRNKAIPASLEREIRKGLADYRSTIHLQAAMVLHRPSVSVIETSLEGLIQFLTFAKAIETFIDNNVVSEAFIWDPWRVPMEAPRPFNIEVSRLSQKELDLINEA